MKRIIALCLCAAALCTGCTIAPAIPGTQIQLTGETARVQGTSVRAANGVVTISAGGDYVVRGDLTGQLVVDAGKDEGVTLTLAGASIAAVEGAALMIRSADTVTIRLERDTVNRLIGGDSPDAGEPDVDAALYSKADLGIAGAGALTVEGRLHHGILSKDALTIDGGTIAVSALGDGLRGRDAVAVSGGTLTISAEGDGIQANGDGGAVRLEGGEIQIAAGKDGVKAEADLFVAGGTLELVAGQDALNAGGDLTIAGGDLTIEAGDDAAHADGDIWMRGGALHATRCHEGLEGMSVTIEAGTLDIVTLDDGINGAGGDDGADMGNRTAHTVAVRGGEITIVADSDAIDCNGDIAISGGTLNLTTNNPGRGTKTLDADGDVTITGGVVVTSDGAERDARRG